MCYSCLYVEHHLWLDSSEANGEFPSERHYRTLFISWRDRSELHLVHKLEKKTYSSGMSWLLCQHSLNDLFDRLSYNSITCVWRWLTTSVSKCWPFIKKSMRLVKESTNEYEKSCISNMLLQIKKWLTIKLLSEKAHAYACGLTRFCAEYTCWVLRAGSTVYTITS